MKSRLFVVSMAVLVLVLALTAGYALAQTANPEDAVQPEIPADVNAAVSRRFTYQGVLKEDGQPVTGNRAMHFYMHTDGNCTTPIYDSSNSSVPVMDGLFSFELWTPPHIFNGQAIWLEVTVEGETLGCQKITAVPYALSLVPGAYMLGSVTGDAMLTVENQSDTGSGSGIWVQTNASEGRALVGGANSNTGINYGVYGASGSPNGYGLYGVNPDGVAVGAHGAIQSTADTELYLSPHDLVVRANGDPLTLPDVDIYPLEAGGVRVQNATGSDLTTYLSFPMSTYGTLLGAQMYVKSVEICYTASNATIDVTAAIKNVGTATGYAFYTLDNTNHNEGSYACYTVEDAMPHTPIDNSSWVQLNVNMFTFPPVYLDIYTVKVTLTEFASD
jgi:hypothetical protein